MPKQYRVAVVSSKGVWYENFDAPDFTAVCRFIAHWTRINVLPVVFFKVYYLGPKGV